MFLLRFCVVFQTSSNVENLSPQIIKQVAREMHGLASNPPEGIKIFTNDEDITDIQATIEGPSKYECCPKAFPTSLKLYKL